MPANYLPDIISLGNHTVRTKTRATLESEVGGRKKKKS